MIEIKCTTEREKELLLHNFATKESKCPFIGLCREQPYYRTGMSCRECLENNIKWTITDGKPETSEEEKSESTPSKEVTITEAQWEEIAANAAVDYYKPYMGGDNLREFIMSSRYMAIVARRLFKEDK